MCILITRDKAVQEDNTAQIVKEGGNKILLKNDILWKARHANKRPVYNEKFKAYLTNTL